MRIIISIETALPNGLDTPLSGEFRYLCNLAEMLAETEDVSVSCLSFTSKPNPSRATKVRLLTSSSLNLAYPQYDICIGLGLDYPSLQGWRLCSITGEGAPIKASLYMHYSFFGFPDLKAVAKNYTCLNGAHVLLRPYKFVKRSTSTPSEEYLPFPFFCNKLQRLDDVSLDKKKNLIWTTKDVFSEDQTPQVHKEAANTLEAYRDFLSKNADWGLFIVSGISLYNSIAKSYGIPNILDSIKNKTIHMGLISRPQMRSLLEKSRLCTIFSGYGSSCFDAVAAGTLPIFFSIADQEPNNFFATRFPENVVLEPNMKPKEISSIISDLCLTSRRYIDLYTKASTAITDHCWDYSRQRFYEIVKSRQ